MLVLVLVRGSNARNDARGNRDGDWWRIEMKTKRYEDFHRECDGTLKAGAHSTHLCP